MKITVSVYASVCNKAAVLHHLAAFIKNPHTDTAIKKRATEFAQRYVSTIENMDNNAFSKFVAGDRPYLSDYKPGHSGSPSPDEEALSALETHLQKLCTNKPVSTSGVDFRAIKRAVLAALETWLVSEGRKRSQVSSLRVEIGNQYADLIERMTIPNIKKLVSLNGNLMKFGAMLDTTLFNDAENRKALSDVYAVVKEASERKLGPDTVFSRGVLSDRSAGIIKTQLIDVLTFLSRTASKKADNSETPDSEDTVLNNRVAGTAIKFRDAIDDMDVSTFRQTWNSDDWESIELPAFDEDDEMDVAAQGEVITNIVTFLSRKS